jgi:hypothetical protein
MTTRPRWLALTPSRWATALFAFSCAGFAACSAEDDAGLNNAPVTPTGGQSTGGASAGGSATGGTATGGAATGGASKGGASTGGSPSAGASTGGASTGGASTGGSQAGGAGGVGNPGGGGSGGQPGNKGGAGAGGMAVGGGGASNGGSGGGSGGGGTSSGGGASGFQPCPAAEVCKILPLGDSITDGIGFSGGYRVELFNKATMDGHDITFVGGSMNGPSMVAGKTFPKNHEGHSGWTISQIDGITPDPALGPKPHIVLLHIGTNDMYQMPSGAPERLGTLIDQIVTTLPDALLVVSNIIPFPQGAAAVTTYNAAVPGIVNMRISAGKHIILVDQFKDFPTSELGDGVHPNQAGYARMAGVWYTAIESYLR